MTDETKELLKFQLSMLKQTMKDNGIMFAFAIDKADVDNSSLYFMDKEQYFSGGQKDGFSVRLTELNKGLI